jgi:hypothetical protein
MSERNLVNVWIYPYLPNDWRCQTFEGITGIGRSREEAKATFDRDWNQRAPYNLIEGHPPRQGHEKPAGAALEGDSAAARVFRDLTKEFHPDVHHGKKFTAGEVMAALNRLWDAMKAKS